MNTAQINCFMALAEHKSFSETAEKMFVAQPTLSKYIKSLEEELELQLVDRSHRQIRLTPEGQLLYDYFKKNQEEFSDIIFKAHNLGKKQESLSVVLLEGLDPDQIVKPLLDYQFYNGTVSISFEQLPSYQIPTFLENGKYNMAITMLDRINSANKTKKNICYEKIMPSRLMLYYSVRHPVNQLARTPSFVDFKDDVFFIPSYFAKVMERDMQQGTMPFDLYEEWLGFLPKFKIVESIASVIPNVLNGNGISIMSEHSRLYFSSNVRAMPSPVVSDIVFAWCQERESDLIRDVVEFNRSYSSGKLMI